MNEFTRTITCHLPRWTSDAELSEQVILSFHYEKNEAGRGESHQLVRSQVAFGRRQAFSGQCSCSHLTTQNEKTGTNVMMEENELEQRKKYVSSHREARRGREDRTQQRVQKKEVRIKSLSTGPSEPSRMCSPSRRGLQPFTVRPLSTSTRTLLPSIFLPSACL